ncbi:MAG: peroxiredoxin family protein [Egibacteraceae bacterium]
MALTTAVLAALAVAILAAVFVTSQTPAPGAAGGAIDRRYPYVVGDPGPGVPAPGFTLPSTAGYDISLSDFQGQSILLYFQEGLMCPPCWDQLREVEARWDDFAALGVDALLTVTNDPLAALTQKAALERLGSLLLSNRDLAVSRTYDANEYGMMGGSHNGHSFIVVGPDGIIRWRADYGGAPEYTMYLPVEVLLADLRAGLGDA